MTVGHKIEISNLIYFHQYPLTHYEFHMFISWPPKMGTAISASSLPFLFPSAVVNLYYPFHPVSKSHSAIVVWITSDKTSPFVCLAVGSVQVMFALSPAHKVHTHTGTTGNLTLTGAVDFMLITSYRFSFVRPGGVTFAFLNCEAEHLKEDQPSMGMPGPL